MSMQALAPTAKGRGASISFPGIPESFSVFSWKMDEQLYD